jgi:hypothetical protein
VAPVRWAYYGDRVLAEIRKAPADVQEAFYLLMYELTKNPRRAGLGILPLKDGPGDQFTVPFDAAQLIYELFADHPWIHLLYVHWLNGQSGPKA